MKFETTINIDFFDVRDAIGGYDIEIAGYNSNHIFERFTIYLDDCPFTEDFKNTLESYKIINLKGTVKFTGEDVHFYLDKFEEQATW